MPDAYLYYFNANVEGRLPHPLSFKNSKIKLEVDQEATGQVYVVVGIGVKGRQHYLWSTFNATECKQLANGRYSIAGDGWQLCPPVIIKRTEMESLVSNLAIGQFKTLPDAQRSTWIGPALKYRPPGEPYEISEFLKSVSANISNPSIERVMGMHLKAIGPVKPPKGTAGPRKPAEVVSNFVPSTPITPKTEIRCLSIRQPWVECIMQGKKDVENRDWANLSSIPSYRGWLAIHASKTRDGEGGFDLNGCWIPESLPTGCIAGLAHLNDIVHVNDYRKACRKNKIKPSVWAEGEHCLLLSNAIRLPEPIPFSGRLGVFMLEEGLQARLRSLACEKV